MTEKKAESCEFHDPPGPDVALSGVLIQEADHSPGR